MTAQAASRVGGGVTSAGPGLTSAHTMLCLSKVSGYPKQARADLLLQLQNLSLLHLLLQLYACFATVGLALSLSSRSRLKSLHHSVQSSQQCRETGHNEQAQASLAR